MAIALREADVRKALKGIGIVLAGILVLALLAVTYIYILTGSWLEESYDIQVNPVDIPDSPPAELTGFQQMVADFCVECHGPGAAGQVLEDDPMVATLVAPNLTSGWGGLGGSYRDEDWARALRHGVGIDGQSLLVMPSDTFYHLSDADLAAVVAYIKSFPPVDRYQLPPIKLGPMGRLFLLQEPNLLAARVIDHQAPRPPDPEPGVSAAYGKYLANVCIVCHGPDLAGGPTESSGLNLTPAGDLGSWSEADFINTLRTGKTPEGELMDPVEMPWREIGKMSDEELKAIWLYLQTLPPVETSIQP